MGKSKEPANLVGPQIQKVRYQMGLTQERLAARCQLMGLDISRATLAQIESRLRCVTDKELLLFARILGISTDGLFSEEMKRAQKRKPRR
jgi:transcriptional regulator with XRE-family HTH domain